MKISYSTKLGQFILTERGNFIDSDCNYSSLLERNKVFEDPEFGNFQDIEILQEPSQNFEISSFDDDLSTIEDFLFDDGQNNQRISHYADPEKFTELFEQFTQETPDCPWNEDAAECLAKPPERQGWQISYVEARENWKDENY
jgi:hypothetical protein